MATQKSKKSYEQILQHLQMAPMMHPKRRAASRNPHLTPQPPMQAHLTQASSNLAAQSSQLGRETLAQTLGPTYTPTAGQTSSSSKQMGCHHQGQGRGQILEVQGQWQVGTDPKALLQIPYSSMPATCCSSEKRCRHCRQVLLRPFPAMSAVLMRHCRRPRPSGV